MEISKDNYNTLKEYLYSSIENKYEFEARICSKTFKDSDINYYQFEKILNYLIFSKENKGCGLKNYMETSLDISHEETDIRVVINDTDSIKKFWLNDDISKLNNKYSVLQKKRINNLDLSEYNIRVSVSHEISELNDQMSKADEIVKSYSTKTYRFKKRVCVISDDGNFRFDLTSLKMSTGSSFKSSRVLNAVASYEIEIEYIGKVDNIDENGIDELTQKFISNICILLQLYQNSNILITNTSSSVINDKYNNLINNINGNVQTGNKINNKIRNSNKYENNFIAVNPVTLHVENLLANNSPSILNNYAVTYKADGSRRLLLVTETLSDANCFLISDIKSVINTGLKLDGWENTLIECEYMEDTFSILAYDILVYKGTDVREYGFIKKKEGSKDRLSLLDEFCNIVKQANLKTDYQFANISRKIYETGSGDKIFAKAKKLWDAKDNNNYYSDGLIFLPAYEPYPKRMGTWMNLLKWKPPQYNSIDFLINSEKRDGTNVDKKSPYIISSNEIGMENKAVQYKTFNLKVGGYRDVYNGGSNAEKKCQPVDFLPSGTDTAINKANLLLDTHDRIIGKDVNTGLLFEVLDDTIVEFVYDNTNPKFCWIPIKVRHDKTEKYKRGANIFGNYETVAHDIWESIVMPVTVEMITTGNISIEKNNISTASLYYSNSYDAATRMPYQNFHNLIIKRSLIMDTSPSKLNATPDTSNAQFFNNYTGALLDLGCGRGGDLNKWNDARYKTVVGIDAIYDNIDKAIQFYNNMQSNKPTVTYLHGDVEKLIFPHYLSSCNEPSKLQFEKSLHSKYLFDTVSCQFAIHYFFKNEITLRTLLQNVTDNLKIGGFFIGTSFDGERVFNLLKGKKEHVVKLDGENYWYIKKNYTKSTYANDKPNYGTEIKVYIQSIGKEHIEYLANYEYLSIISKEYGLELVESKGFGELYESILKNGNMHENNTLDVVKSLSIHDKDLSFLNNIFIFKKIRQAPDSIYTKLIKLIEKADTKAARNSLKNNKNSNKIIKEIDENNITIISDKEELI